MGKDPHVGARPPGAVGVRTLLRTHGTPGAPGGFSSSDALLPPLGDDLEPAVLPEALEAPAASMEERGALLLTSCSVCGRLHPPACPLEFHSLCAACSMEVE